MDPKTNSSVLISRRQIVIGLILAGFVLLVSIAASAVLFTTTALALLMPIPGAALFLGVFYLLLKEQPGESDTIASLEVPALETELEPAPLEPSANPDRTITVDEDREVYGIYATLQTMSSSLSPADTLNFIADRLSRLIPGATVVFALTDDASEPLSVTAKFGRYAHLFALGDAIGEDEAISLARNGRRAVSGFIRPNSRDTGAAEEERPRWPAIAAPVVFEETVHGAVGLFRGGGRGFVEAETAQLESVALFASTGIHQAWTQRQSRDSAMFDAVSNLPNLRAAHTIVDQRIAEALRHRTDEPLGLICLSFDGVGGDIMQLGQAVGAQLRHMDILTRGEENEFWIVLPRSGRPEAALVADRVSRALRSKSPSAPFSLGIASFPVDGATGSELFAHARTALHSAASQTIDGSFDNVVLVDQWR